METKNYIAPQSLIHSLVAEGALCLSVPTPEDSLPDYNPSEGEW